MARRLTSRETETEQARELGARVLLEDAQGDVLHFHVDGCFFAGQTSPRGAAGRAGEHPFCRVQYRAVRPTETDDLYSDFLAISCVNSRMDLEQTRRGITGRQSLLRHLVDLACYRVSRDSEFMVFHLFLPTLVRFFTC